MKGGFLFVLIVSSETTDRGKKMKNKRTRKNGKFAAIAVAMFCAVSITATASQTWYVDAVNGNDANRGTSWSESFSSIQAAIDIAANDDTVLVTNGVYSPIATTKLLSIQSIEGPNSTFIDGKSISRCALFGQFTEGSNSVIVSSCLKGFTLMNGVATNGLASQLYLEKASGFGAGGYGGIFSDCVFSNCWAICGGAASHAELYDCQFFSNRAIPSRLPHSGGKELL